jgi:DNA-binding beta-propeller fold protein YncE
MILGVPVYGPLSTSPAGAAAIQAPGCSTTVAAAPDLTDVGTDFVGGPEEPFGVAITADGRTGFVADASGAIVVYSLNGATPTLEEVDAFRTERSGQAAPPPFGGVSPLGLSLTPDGRYLVAAEGSGADVFSVAALERKGAPRFTWSVGQLRSGGQGAIETAVSADGRYVFVTLEDSNVMAVFDLGRALRRGFGPSDLVGTVPLGIAPVGMAIAPDGRRLYVTSEATASHQQVGTLTTVDLARAERRPAHAVISTVSAGCSPVRVAATDTSVYVTARGSDALLAYNAKDLVDDPASALDGEVQVGEAPVGVVLVDHDRSAVVADSDRFSTSGEGASLAVVTTAGGGMALVGYVKAGSFPRDMAVDRQGNAVLVGNFSSGQLEGLDVQTLP